jgi:uncharacterized protein YkwD
MTAQISRHDAPETPRPSLARKRSPMNLARTCRTSVASVLLGATAAFGIAATLTGATTQAIAAEGPTAATTLSISSASPPTRPRTAGLSPRRLGHATGKVKRPGTVALTGSAGPAPASRCANSNLVPAPGNAPAVEAATLCLINQVRAEHGVGPLVESAKLDRAALSHDADMVSQGYFNHVGPAGDTPKSRIRTAGYVTASSVGIQLGENIACATLGLASPTAIVASWVASPPHLASILNSRFRDTGIAVVAAAPAVLASSEAGATYTEDFAAA